MKTTHEINCEIDDIQEAGNTLLETSLKNLCPEFRWVFKSQEHQKDKGIDYEIEIINRQDGRSVCLFKIQNKGKKKRLQILRKTENKGLMAYSISLRVAKYYRYQINIGLIFTVSDLEANVVYWHPVQLDDSIDEKIRIAEDNGKDSITIYISPERFLSNETSGKFLHEINCSIAEQLGRYQFHNYNLFSLSEIEICKSDHILDQLFAYLSIITKELSYIPVSSFVRQYPFKKGDFTPYYSNLRLEIDNGDIISLLENVDVRDHKELIIKDQSYFSNVANFESKLLFVFKALSNNLIYEISDRANRRKVYHFHLYDDFTYSGEKCYNVLKLSEAISNIHIAADNTKEKMSIAYNQYQLGNFIEAAKSFENISNSVKETNKCFYFICQYNLKRLGIFITNNYWNDNKAQKYGERLKEIDLDSVYAIAKDSISKDLLIKLKEKTIYDHAQSELESTAKKIIDHYYSSLKGGWSSNNHSLELIIQFAELDYFLNKNYIIHDKFFDFTVLFERFLEAIFASHSIKENQRGRLEFFDDWLIHRILFYGKQEWITKYFHRYKMKTILYKKTSIDGDSFFDLINNFFTDSQQTLRNSRSRLENDGDYFYDQYSRIFSNIIVLISYVEMNTKDLKITTGSLLDFLEEDKVIHPYHLEKINIFLYRKGHLLQDNQLKKFLTLFLNNERFHNDFLFESLFDAIIRKETKISLGKGQFRKLKGLFFGKCPICNNNHATSLLVNLSFYLQNPIHQSEIKDIIEKILSTSFESELYYIASIHDLLPFDEINFEKFFLYAIPETMTEYTNSKIVQVKSGSFWGNKSECTHPTVDKFLNLCFKYRIVTNQDKYSVLKGISPYYDWLIDMENFDYRNFDVNWLKEYSTRYYFNEFEKHPSIKNKLIEYLRENQSSELNELFLNLYYLKPGRV